MTVYIITTDKYVAGVTATSGVVSVSAGSGPSQVITTGATTEQTSPT